MYSMFMERSMGKENQNQTQEEDGASGPGQQLAQGCI